MALGATLAVSPSLAGAHDEHMPVHYDLHAWVSTNNPSGDLAPWNPRVSCELEAVGEG